MEANKTMVKLYNTLSRKIEEFIPVVPDKVGIYSCGPTVYSNQHIGNMYCYIQWDVLVRFFKYLGFDTKWVMNITDVGHLTGDNLGDADAGEDKMERGARRENLTVWEIAEKYIDQFLESVDLLNIRRPDVLCRATQHINEQIELIKKIEVNGFTYQTQTGLVFDTAKFPEYPDFAHLDLTKQVAGARVEVDPEKKHPWDFLLWVTNQPEHVMQWDSPWGRGFPGWHIECTAMSTEYLGERFDIHTGGIEHVSVHHTNEIAQGYAAFGHQTANYWLHNAWLLLESEKISKSGGNYILVTEFNRKGYDPLAFRYLALTSHYRAGLNFTWEALKAAASGLERLREMVRLLRKNSQENSLLSVPKLAKVDKYRLKFQSALSHDLGLPQALAVVWEMLKSDISSYDKLDLLLDFDQVLGLKLALVEEIKIPKRIKELAQKRYKLRAENQWAAADEIRLQIEAEGYLIEDTAQNYWIKKK